MPKAMTEAEVDPIAEQVDQQMMESGEATGIPQHSVNLNGNFGDLSNGGRVGDATITPVGESGRVVFDKRLREPGRPTVRQVYTWDGRASTIPLAYEPSGKRHDGGRKYLLKRHCTVCNYSGFYGPVCPACRKDGRELAPPVPAYYLKREQVPNPQVFFGHVDCFVTACVRRGKYGFLDEMTMRQHAMSKHRLEYRALQDSQQSRNDQELMALRNQVAALMAQQMAPRATSSQTEEQRQRSRERMAKVRAAKKPTAAPETPSTIQ